MSEKRDNETWLDRGLRQRLNATGAGEQPCPEPEILAAYFDRTLTEPERAQWEPHFSACAHCQQQLALLARSEPAVEAERAPVRAWFGFAHRRWLWNWRWLAPATAAAAALALWVAIRPPSPRLEPPTVRTEQQITPSSDAAREKAAEQLSDRAARQEQPKPAEPTAQEGSPQSHRGERAETDVIASGREASTSRAVSRLPAPAEQKQRDIPQSGTIAEMRVQTAPAVSGAQAAAPGAAVSAPGAGAMAAPPAGVRRADVQEEKAKESREVAAVQTEAVSPSAAGGRLGQAPQKDARKSEVGAPEKAEKVQAANVARSQEPVAAMGAKQAPVDKPAEPLLRRERALRDAAAKAEFRAATSLVQVKSPNAAVLWTVGASGIIAYSRDTGKTWHVQASGVDADLVAGASPAETVCWVVGRAGTVLRITDGEHWEKIAFPVPADLVKVEARDPQNAIVTTADARVYVTSDGGRTWRLRP